MTVLGPKETELIATIGSKRLRVFTVSEAARSLHISNTEASQIA
jgi:hypothetical protein